MNEKERKRKELIDEIYGPYNGEYLGNVFGWKVSLIGLAVLLFFVAIIAYRHYQLKDWNMMTEEERVERLK